MSTSSDHEPAPPDSSTLVAGQTVGGGRYVLKKILGQGGMGVVWLAHDKRLREPVALKFLPPQIAFDPAALEDLRRETWRSRKLSHPNIVRIHDLHEGEGERPFITMEYVDGPNLHYLRATKPGRVLNWKFLAPILRQLCTALEYAHEEKVVHRDLKPANLMLDSNGRLKLADFGLACVVHDSMTRLTGHPAAGTLDYMSPQQADGKKAQISDDLYALGASLYDLLTSKPPFHTGDVPYQLRNTRPDPMPQRLADLELTNEIPSDVAALVMACLAKDPEQRPPSARAIIDWLDSAANASPVPPVWAPIPPVAPTPTPTPPPVLPPPIVSVTPSPPAVSDVPVPVVEDPVVEDLDPPEPAPSSWDSTSVFSHSTEPEADHAAPETDTAPSPLPHMAAVAMHPPDSEPRASKSLLVAAAVIAVVSTLITIAIVTMLVRAGVKQTADVASPGATNAAPSFTPYVPSPNPSPAGPTLVSGNYEGIFNGRDLTGWSGDPRNWTVTNGAILGRSSGPNIGRPLSTALVYQGAPVDDFELRFSFRLQEGAYDVLYRAQELPNQTATGYAYNISPGSIGHIHVLLPGGSRRSVMTRGARDAMEAARLANVFHAVLRTNDWNEAVIIAQGGRMRHELNGLVLVDASDLGPQRLTAGRLAVNMIFTSPRIPPAIEFKNFRLKRLSAPGVTQPVPPPAAPAGPVTAGSTPHATRGLHETLSPHQGPVRAVAFSPNGLIVASGGDDQLIHLWLPRHQRMLTPLAGHNNSVLSVAFSPLDSHILVSGGDDRALKLWNASTRKQLWIHVARLGLPNSVLFSADGQTIFVGTGGGTIECRRADTGVPITTLQAHQGPVNHLAISPDGRWLASAGGDATIRIWNVSNRELEKTFDRLPTNMTCLSFSPDERTLAAAGGENRYHLFDVPLGILKRSTPAFNTTVRALVYQPDGEWLVVNGDGRTSGLQLSAADGALRSYRFPNGTSNITTMAVAPDGLLVYGTDEGRIGHSVGGVSGPPSTADPFGPPDPARIVKRKQPVEPPAIVPTPTGWVRLMDGRTLRGWETIGNGQWTVQADGSVTSRGNPGALVSTAQYENFELKADVKFAYGGVAAVGFRLPPGAAEGLGGFVMQACNDIPPGVTKAPVLTKLGTIHNYIVPHDTWATLRVVANGNKFQTYLNDQMTMNMSPSGAPSARGQVALLHYVPGVAVSYRNVMIHPLSAVANAVPANR